MDIFSLLNLAKERAASDLHLVASSPPMLRINGSLEPAADMAQLTPDDINQAFSQITTPEEGPILITAWSWISALPYPMSAESDAMRLGNVGLSVSPFACCHRPSRL